MDSILDTRIVDVQWIRNGYMAGLEGVTWSAAVFRSLAPPERDKVMNSARLTFGRENIVVSHYTKMFYAIPLRAGLRILIVV